MESGVRVDVRHDAFDFTDVFAGVFGGFAFAGGQDCLQEVFVSIGPTRARMAHFKLC